MSRPSWVVVSCRRLSQPDARFAIIRHSVSTPVFAGRHSVWFARVELFAEVPAEVAGAADEEAAD